MPSRGCSRPRRSSRSVNAGSSALGRDRARLARAVLGRAEAKEARAGSAAAGGPDRGGKGDPEKSRAAGEARPAAELREGQVSRFPGRAEGRERQAAAPEGRDETEMMRVTKQARPLIFALIAAAMLALVPAGRLALAQGTPERSQIEEWNRL